MPNSDKKIEVFFDSDKGKMPELKPPTTEMVIEAGKDLEACPEVKSALKKMYPAAFEPEPIEMEGKIKNSKGNVIVRVSEDGLRIVLDKCFKWELLEEERRVNASVTPTRK